MSKHSGVTLEQIAQRAGCSVAVVSKTLNGSKSSAGVSEAMRLTVERISQELGYSPNCHARALQRGSSRTLGIVYRILEENRFDADFWGLFLQGVERKVCALKYNLLLCGPTTGNNELEQGIQSLRERRIDALIVLAPIYTAQLAQLRAVDAPIVLAASEPVEGHATVGTDFTPGIRQAFAHLIALGHAELLWVVRTLGEVIDDEARHQTVQQLAEEAGIRLQTFIVNGDALERTQTVSDYIAECKQQFAGYLRANRPCSAILAFNERMGFGIGAALTENGLRVPHDVSLISFGDLYGHVAIPPMTVISNRLLALGERAAELALEIFQNAESVASYRDHFEQLNAELIVRSSTAVCPPTP